MRMTHRAYRSIAINPEWVNEGMRDDAAGILTSNFRMVAEKATIVNISNVAEMYAESDCQEWDADSFPALRLPFPVCILEWDNPKEINYGTHRMAAQRGQALVTLVSLPINKAKPSRGAIKAWGQANGCGNVAITEEDCRIFDDAHEWIVGQLYVSWFDKPMCGRVAWGGLSWVWPVAADGSHSGKACCIGPNGPRVMGEWASYWHIPKLAISLLNCRNVSTVNVAQSKDETKAVNRSHMPQFTYKTLVIDVMKKVLRAEGGLAVNGLAKAMHICRGHFRTYGEDSPGLFGRMHGTFWVPQHIRGDAAVGVVHKDYALRGTT